MNYVVLIIGIERPYDSITMVSSIVPNMAGLDYRRIRLGWFVYREVLLSGI